MNKYVLSEISEQHKGQVIYLQGSDNNRSRSGLTAVVAYEVIEVTRAQALLRCQDDVTKELTIKRNGRSAHDFNYDIYLTLADFKASLALRQIRDAIVYGQVSTDSTLQIAETLGIEISIKEYVTSN